MMLPGLVSSASQSEREPMRRLGALRGVAREQRSTRGGRRGDSAARGCSASRVAVGGMGSDRGQGSALALVRRARHAGAGGLRTLQGLAVDLRGVEERHAASTAVRISASCRAGREAGRGRGSSPCTRGRAPRPRDRPHELTRVHQLARVHMPMAETSRLPSLRFFIAPPRAARDRATSSARPLCVVGDVARDELHDAMKPARDPSSTRPSFSRC